MRAVRIHPSSGDQYGPSNPAPSSALHIDEVPKPLPSKPGEILVRVKSASIIRDTLTWPEMYHSPYMIPGNDFSGIVEAVFAADKEVFQPGDEVFGMTHAERASTWAEFVLVHADEVAKKPSKLLWSQAACVPLSALTAWQALFVHAGLPVPGTSNPRQASKAPSTTVLVTGASGGVGMYLVQLAAAAKLRVTAATSSNARNQQFLLELGAHETLEYTTLQDHPASFDAVIDTVGGTVLKSCWQAVKAEGSLISVDSASYDFVAQHREANTVNNQDAVKAAFFIVEPSANNLHQIATAIDKELLNAYVSDAFPLESVKEAYDLIDAGKAKSRGKVVLSV